MITGCWRCQHSCSNRVCDQLLISWCLSAAAMKPWQQPCTRQLQNGMYLTPPFVQISLAVSTALLVRPCVPDAAWACSLVLMTSSGCKLRLTTAPEADPVRHKLPQGIAEKVKSHAKQASAKCKIDDLPDSTAAAFLLNFPFVCCPSDLAFELISFVRCFSLADSNGYNLTGLAKQTLDHTRQAYRLQRFG